MVRQVIRNSLKRKAQDEICERPLKLIDHELKKINTDTLRGRYTERETYTTLDRWRSAPYRRRLGRP